MSLGLWSRSRSSHRFCFWLSGCRCPGLGSWRLGEFVCLGSGSSSDLILSIHSRCCISGIQVAVTRRCRTQSSHRILVLYILQLFGHRYTNRNRSGPLSFSGYWRAKSTGNSYLVEEAWSTAITCCSLSQAQASQRVVDSGGGVIVILTRPCQAIK